MPRISHEKFLREEMRLNKEVGENCILHKDIFSFSIYIKLILFLLIAIIVTWFWVKAASVGINKGGLDFATPYFATKAWLQGANPYDDLYISQLWHQETGNTVTKLTETGRLSVYPITTFPILAPFTLLDFYDAKTLWILLNLLFLILQIAIFIRMANFNYTQLGALLIAFSALLFNPTRAAFIQANPGFFTISCVIFSLWASNKNKEILSGILIALGCAIKPHIGIPFLFLYTIQTKWKILIIVIVSLSVMLMLSLIPAGFEQTLTYLVSCCNNIAASISKGGINDPSANNPLNFHLINLQHPLWSIFNNGLIVNSIVFFVVGLELLIFMNLIISLKIKQIDLIQISTLAAIILLPVYHRNYDASLLIASIALAIQLSCSKYRLYSIITIVVLTPFMIINSADYLVRFSKGGAISFKLAQSLLWKGFIIPHQSWLILLLSINSLCLMNSLYKEYVNQN
jgi:Glycosyltransferase family 87